MYICVFVYVCKYVHREREREGGGEVEEKEREQERMNELDRGPGDWVQSGISFSYVLFVLFEVDF